MSDPNYAPLPVADSSGENSETAKYHTFINLALGLAAITGVELVLVYVPFHAGLIFAILLALSIFKFIAVLAWFMHLVYDKMILTLAFGTGLAIATGTFVALSFIMDPGFVDYDAITQFDAIAKD